MLNPFLRSDKVPLSQHLRGEFVLYALVEKLVDNSNLQIIQLPSPVCLQTSFTDLYVPHQELQCRIVPKLSLKAVTCSDVLSSNDDNGIPYDFITIHKVIFVFRLLE